RSPDPADFPSPGPFPPRAHALLPAEPLRQAVRRTLFAAANEPGCCLPYLLEAVLCELGRDRLRLVASDNRRLAAADVPVPAGRRAARARAAARAAAARARPAAAGVQPGRRRQRPRRAGRGVRRGPPGRRLQPRVPARPATVPGARRDVAAGAERRRRAGRLL